MTPDIGWHSGWDTPEEPAAEAAAGHQRPCSEGWVQPPAEDGNPPAQWAEKRPAECDNRIPWSRRPMAVENDQMSDQSSYSVYPWSPRGYRSIIFRESWSPSWQSGDSVSADDHSFGPGSYWDGWRGAEVLLPDPCQRTQVNQPWCGSGSHQGSKCRQDSRPKWYTEQGPEASSPASGVPPSPAF